MKKVKKMYPKLKPTKIKWEGKRIVGCQSTNHASCKGELWECERCHKVICWEEGYADDLVDYCDDCWYDIRVLGYEYLTPLDHGKNISMKVNLGREIEFEFFQYLIMIYEGKYRCDYSYQWKLRKIIQVAASESV